MTSEIPPTDGQSIVSSNRPNRRRFLELFAAAGVGSIAGCASFGSEPSEDPNTEENDQSESPTEKDSFPKPVDRSLPEQLLPAVAIDDGMRLAELATDTVPDVIAFHLRPRGETSYSVYNDLEPEEFNRQVATTAGAIGTLGSFGSGYLEVFQDNVPDPEAFGREPNEMFTLVFGALLHQGLAGQIRPLHDLESDAKRPPASTERSVYHDAAVLGRRSRALGGVEPTDSDPTAVRELFDRLWWRSLVRMHTITPDGSEIDRWIDDFSTWREDALTYREQFATAYADPDPELLEQYVDEPDLYDPEDELLEVVRSHHRGDGDANPLGSTLETAEEGSLYTKGLRDGLANLETAGEFLEGEIDAETLENRLRR